MSETFPFGKPITWVEQKNRIPKEAFVLGVYASANLNQEDIILTGDFNLSVKAIGPSSLETLAVKATWL